MYEIEIRRNSQHEKMGEEVGVVMCVAVLEYVPLGSSLLINHFRLSVSYTCRSCPSMYINQYMYTLAVWCTTDSRFRPKANLSGSGKSRYVV
jgi:hypothetical protein